MSETTQDGQIDEEDRELLGEVLGLLEKGPALPERTSFRAAHANARKRLDELERSGLISNLIGRYRITPLGLRALRSPPAKIAYERSQDILKDLQGAYLESQAKHWNAEQFGARFQRATAEVARIITLLSDAPGLVVHRLDGETGFIAEFALGETILDAVLPAWHEEDGSETSTARPELEPFISIIEISGYRPFAGFSAGLGHLTVMIGANASGKSSLFDALRLLTHAVESPLPPELDPRSEPGRAVFHIGGPQQIDIAVESPLGPSNRLRYEVSIQGPLGAPHVALEHLATTQPLSASEQGPFTFLAFRGGKGTFRNIGEPASKRGEYSTPPNELALRRIYASTPSTPAQFRSFVASWRFYAGFDVSPRADLRRPAYIDQDPVLAEDGSNLTAVLNSLVLEHHDAWEELEMHLRAAIPGFESLNVKPRGARGMAMAFWRERGVKEELTLSDLSDGTLRLLCWLCLALSPNLSPVVCIDEPELGIHPRVLPTLAGAFKIASSRSQILIATHSPYFLSQFDLDEIAVMRKEDGRTVFVRPGTSQAIRREVEEVGGEALASLFVSEELEVLP
jgi:predicted ATPase